MPLLVGRARARPDLQARATNNDASGTIAYELATSSVLAILDPDGTVDGWIPVTTPDGLKAVAKTSSTENKTSGIAAALFVREGGLEPDRYDEI